MLKPLLKPVLGVALMLCSAQALADESNPGKIGVITGGGRGGDGVDGGAGDESNYYYVYLGAYFDTPKLAGPLSWRFGTLLLDYSGIWYQSGLSGQYQARAWRLMTGPSFFVILPNEWWFWDGIQVGLDREDTGPGCPLLMIQNELMFGLGFFSSYWNILVRLTPDAGYQVSYLLWQLFFRLAPWFAFGPELRRQTSAPSIGLMLRIGENRSEPRWTATVGSTFDEKLGGQWHLDLWFAF